MATYDSISYQGDADRPYILINHFTHSHRLYLDQIGPNGGGRTSGWSPHFSFQSEGIWNEEETVMTSRQDPHEHNIRDYEIQGANIRLYPHFTPEEYANDWFVLSVGADLFIPGESTTTGAAYASFVELFESIYSSQESSHHNHLVLSVEELKRIKDEYEASQIFVIPLVSQPFLVLDPPDFASWVRVTPPSEMLTTSPRYDGAPNLSEVRSTSVSRLTTAPSRPANSINTDIIEADWQTRGKYKPFYSTNRLEYCTTVEMCEGFIPGSQETDQDCQEIVQQAIAQGILDLAEFYHKQIPPSGDVQRAILNSAEVEYYADKRPKSRVKLLVKIPVSSFEQMDGAKPYSDRPPSKLFHSVILNSFYLRKQIKSTSETFVKLSKQTSKQNIGTPGLDLVGESRRVEKFFSKLNRLLIDNGVSLREAHEDSIEIGLLEGYRIAYILYNNRSMDVGFNAFVYTDPANNPRTVAYISKLSEMEREIAPNGTVDSTGFILRNTYPRPSIVPSNTNSQIPSESVRQRASQATERIADSMEPRISDDIYITSDQKLEEDRLLRDPEFIRQTALSTESNTNFVGDDLLSILPEIIERVDSAEGLFSEVLNKIDLSTIANFAVTAALGQVPTLRNLISGAIGVFFEKIENTNKNTVNSINQGIQSITEMATEMGEVFVLLTSFKELYEQYYYAPIPMLSDMQVYPLRFAAIFGEYMANPGYHSHHPIDQMISIIEQESGANVGMMNLVLQSYERVSLNLDQFDINLGNYLDNKKGIIDGIIDQANFDAPDISSLVNSLVGQFTEIADFYISQAETLFENVISAVENTISDLTAIPERVMNFVSDLPGRIERTIDQVIGDIEERLDRAITLAEDLIQAVKDFPENFINMVNSKIDQIKSEIESKIEEIGNLKDSILDQIDNTITDIVGSVSNIEQFLEDFEIPSVDELFEIPEIPDVFTLPSLPDSLPTFDYMSAAVAMAEDKIKDLVESSIIDVAKNTISSAVEGITSGLSSTVSPSSFDYGGANINSALSDGLGVDNLPVNTGALASMTGQITDMFGQVPPGTDLALVGDRMGSLLSDVSSTLTPNETVTLLEGNPSQNTIGSVANIINSPDYSDLREVFASSPVNEAKIVDFFRHLGQHVGPNTINSIRQSALSTGNPAPSTIERERSMLAARYGDSLNDRQIDQEAQKNSNNKDKKAFKLLQNFSKSSPSPPKDKPPVVLGGKDAIFPKNPPSVDYMVGRTLETMFESIYLFFNHSVNGVGGFIDALSYGSGTRVLFEERRRADKRTQDARPMLQLAAAAVPVPPPPLFATGDPRTQPFSEETSYFELLSSPLASVKAKLAEPISTPLENIFVFSTPAGPYTWNFLKGSNPSSYDHIIQFSAPDRAPFPPGAILQIGSEQVIDASKYSGLVPIILQEVEESDEAGIQDVFASLATHDLKREIPDLDLGPIKEYLRETAYRRTMKDIVQMFAVEILKSKLFNAPTEPYMGDLGSPLANVRNPRAIPNWRLEPPSDTAGQSQTTLLDLEDVREVAKKKYSKSSMKEGEAISDSMQRIILSSVVDVIIRIHVVEMSLRTLPIIDKFKKNDYIKSDEYVKYIKLKIRESCLRQDPFHPGFYENILAQAVLLYDGDWNPDGRNLDPYTGLELSTPETTSSEEALTYLVKKTVLSMSDNIRNMPIFSAGRPKPLDHQLLHEWSGLKGPHGVFDAPTPITPGTDVYEERFEELIVDLDRRRIALREIDPEGDQRQQETASKAPVRSLLTFGDGGLLLEKFIRYTTIPELVSIDTSELEAEETDPTETPGLPSDFGDELEGLTEFSTTQPPPGEPEPPPRTMKVISLTEVEGLSAEEKAMATDIRYGLRLVYIPELGDLRRKPEEWFSNNDDDLTLTERNRVAAENAIILEEIEESFQANDNYHTKSNNSRAFRIRERFKSAVERAEIITEIGRDPREEQSWHDVDIDRITYPLPLATVTTKIAETWPDEMPGYPETKLKNDLKDNQRFKLLFEQCFPLQKILSVMTIYIEILFSTVGGNRLVTTFDQTKETLKSIFDGALNINNFSHRDKNAEAVGGNAGLQSGYVQRDSDSPAVFIRPKKVFPEGRAKVSWKGSMAPKGPAVATDLTGDSGTVSTPLDADALLDWIAAGMPDTRGSRKARDKASLEPGDGFVREVQFCHTDAEQEDIHDYDDEDDSSRDSRSPSSTTVVEEESGECDGVPWESPLEMMQSFDSPEDFIYYMEDYLGSGPEILGYSTWEEVMGDADALQLLSEEVCQIEFVEPLEDSRGVTMDPGTFGFPSREEMIQYLQELLGNDHELLGYSSWDEALDEQETWNFLAEEGHLEIREPPEEPDPVIIRAEDSEACAEYVYTNPVECPIVSLRDRPDEERDLPLRQIVLVRGLGTCSGIREGAGGITDQGDEVTIDRHTGPNQSELEANEGISSASSIVIFEA